MKETRVNGSAHAAIATYADVLESIGSAHAHAFGSLPHRLQQALAQLNELDDVLAASEIEPSKALKSISVFAEAVSDLRQKLVRLEQEVTRAHHMAYHDNLTGLPNRILLHDRLEQAIAHAARRDSQLGLLFIDLNRFKVVNDRFGHIAGDKLLQQAAKRMLECIRGEDTACRYGGDEFVILLSELDGEKSAGEVAQKIHAALAEPYAIDNQLIEITASIGVAVYPGDGNSQEDLITRADSAMYLFKARSSFAV